MLANNTAGVEQNLQSSLKNFDAKTNLTTCITNITETCSSKDIPSGKDIISYDFFVSGNNTIYDPQKLRVFVWEE